MLLTIAIPAYGRPGPLKQALESFISQIVGKYDSDVEIIVADDASPDNSLGFVAHLARKYPFLKYVRYPQNVGLERNLIECSAGATGDFLWIFGDDDFLEPEDAMDDIIRRLRAGEHDMLVLNRTRRSSDLSECITTNWMRLDGQDRSFTGLRDFCLEYGFISVIGFISVNIFRRIPFQTVDAARFFGTMYPQLGAMLEAFHDRPVQLVARPTVCHRTQTAAEKRAALGKKASEADFMADSTRRNAIYFSHPYIAMLDSLIENGAFTPADITRIPENTVINGLLVDFLIDCVDGSRHYPDRFARADWATTKRFFNRLELSKTQSATLKDIFAESSNDETETRLAPMTGQKKMLTISVVTPSYNQGEFLDECLCSVRDQTYQPIEHFVFDPGSTDGSRDIARKYKTVTLFEEPDEGQSDALNKGFARTQGDIIAWLNSDDVFASPDVFQRVIDRFNAPDAPDIVYGKGIYINETGDTLRDVYINKNPDSLHWRLQQEDGILQPALFMRRSVIEDVGELTGSRHYCMDYEYWIRCVAAGKTFAYIDESFALARYHNNNKTYGQRGNSYAEVCDMLVKHFGYANHVWLQRYAEFLSDGFDGVLAHGKNTDIADTAILDGIYRRLMTDYNGSKMVLDHLAANASAKGHGDTLREMQRLGLGPAVPCREVPLDMVSERGQSLYTVGPRRWAFDADWKRREIEKSHAFLREQANNRKSDVCVIVGNGPSLKKANLDLLAGHDVIISNNAFLDKRLKALATYYTVVNYLVAEQSAHSINRLEGLSKILPYWTGYFIEAVGHAEFSKDIFKNASWRHTVTFFNMHIAFGLGYKRAVLIGFDHAYKQEAGVKEGDVIVSNARDENHFDGSYFQGKKWQAADVGMMEQMYLLAKKAYEEEGRELINATDGGKLEVLPRMKLADALAMKPVAETAVRAAEAGTQRSMSKFVRTIPRERHAQVDETAVVARLLAARKGREHIMVDVGAHIGTSAQCFHDLGWSIHCFEPDAKNRAQLEARFSTASNVRIDTRAVSDVAANGVNFFTSPQSTGISGLLDFHETHIISDSVDVTTLTDIVVERNLTRVDFLKIDVEGFDLNVLKGVPWERLKPDVVECEFEDAKTLRLGHTWKDVAEYLRNLGYTVYISEWHPIIRYGISHDWYRVAPYSNHEMKDDAWGNILAFQKDPGYPAILQAFDELLVFRKPPTERKPTTSTVFTAPKQPNITPPIPAKPESKASMLKQTPNASIPVMAPSAQKPAWYVETAYRIHRTSPRLYNVVRFIRRGAVHAVTRPLLALPLAILCLAILYVAFYADLAVYRPWIFTGLAFAVLATLLLYTAFRAQGHAETLHREVDAMRVDSQRATKTQSNQITQQLTPRLTHIQDKLVAFDKWSASLKGDMAATRLALDELRAVNAAKQRKIDTLEAANRELSVRLGQLEASLGSDGQFTTLKKEVSGKVTDVEMSVRLIDDKVTKVDTRVANVDDQIAIVDARVTNIDDQIAKVGARVANVDDQIAIVDARVANVDDQIAKVDARVANVDDQIAKVGARVANVDAKISHVDKWAQFDNATWYQHFNRRLNNDQIVTLETEWRKRLSVPISRAVLGYMADRACEIERQLDGRLATSIEDILLRSLVARAVKGPRIDVLEIGTLFGVGVSVMFDALVNHYEDIHFTLLDPLEGYYNASQADILTGQRIDERTLRRNLERAGMSEDQFTLIKKMSTDNDAIKAAAERQYDLLIIDADHSYAGVKSDFENYARRVKLGGYIIFDDYGSADWPDVQDYVDSEISSVDFIARVGASWRTCVYRVVKNPVD